jgi:hypothetical protein
VDRAIENSISEKASPFDLQSEEILIQPYFLQKFPSHTL